MNIVRSLVLAFSIFLCSASMVEAGWFGLGGDAKEAAKPKKPVSKSQPAPKRNGSSTAQSAKNPKAPKQGFFKSMFNPDPPPPPQTIGDWMKLKQIRPAVASGSR